MNRRVFLQTYGCQMNVRDAEEVLGILQQQGYALAEAPEEADVILMNTCAVREHAEERAISTMGRYQQLKQERPELILGLLGCAAKLQQAALFRRLPALDVICGPAELYDLPALLTQVQERRQQVVSVGRPYRPLAQRPAGDYRMRQVTAFVTIIEGCDKRCAYCIVPMTRGREISRPAGEILEEIRRLAARGYREVTLLGQNVNAYGKRDPDGNGYHGPQRRQQRRAGDTWLDFPGLLRRIDADTDMPRIRFTTSHPFDAHEDLFRAMAECPSVCESLHLPVQSGSNRVLRAMQRGYTVESYRQKIDDVRARIPEIALSTDIIVGFPGETDEDFDATARLLREVEYETAYLFKYSPRPGTPAADARDDIPPRIKAERNQRLLTLQQDIAERKQRAWIGRTAEVLAESVMKDGRLFGRTRTNRSVAFAGSPELVGRCVQVEIEQATPQRLTGVLR